MKVTKIKKEYDSCNFCRRRDKYDMVYQLQTNGLGGLIVTVCPKCIIKVVDFIDKEESGE